MTLHQLVCLTGQFFFCWLSINFLCSALKEWYSSFICQLWIFSLQGQTQCELSTCNPLWSNCNYKQKTLIKPFNWLYIEIKEDWDIPVLTVALSMLIPWPKGWLRQTVQNQTSGWTVVKIRKMTCWRNSQWLPGNIHSYSLNNQETYILIHWPC